MAKTFSSLCASQCEENVFLTELRFMRKCSKTPDFSRKLKISTSIFSNTKWIKTPVKIFKNRFFRIVLYISDGDRFVHFFLRRLFYHSNLDSYNEELMIVHSVLFMGDASIQYSLLITKNLILLGFEQESPAGSLALYQRT